MSITGGGSKRDGGEKKKEDILNIFSVASGHLYERFLRIMMLSVLRHTNTPVKFWFLKNYLSPSFKETISHMAKSYGFQYELVQYKWPRWLHQQTEKQRIIWGYKILFLDVLFPLAVDKIIFVDADQIVRADLKELRDLDLEGAPYGYTPFCDSRKEMDGYRFWKSGYWASHLGQRKYHISALYVVDLKKFRKIAAGDRLRGQYQALSQDPNSLSNLDQDLPNNMIHQVAIKSLPQEWLWCETWCDDASKVTAKTIDLLLLSDSLPEGLESAGVKLEMGLGSMTSITVDFGDGTAISYVNISSIDDGVKHIYNKVGIYQVSATAINHLGFDRVLLYLHVSSSCDPQWSNLLPFLQGGESHCYLKCFSCISDYFRSHPLVFSSNLDELNPGVTEWREDIGRVVKTCIVKVTGISEDQLLVTVLAGLPTTAEVFIVPERRSRDRAMDEKWAHLDQVLSQQIIFGAAIHQ
ncbi:hypothetical protein XENOCAPTIV_005230 [Xenoophorus captivus]|uniref:PKD domain-containing protein n=1 Tax=Xenoophorus captivus TaxID=1517983 RepID=A0ABV0RC39_9TELE